VWMKKYVNVDAILPGQEEKNEDFIEI